MDKFEFLENKGFTVIDGLAYKLNPEKWDKGTCKSENSKSYCLYHANWQCYLFNNAEIIYVDEIESINELPAGVQFSDVNQYGFWSYSDKPLTQLLEFFQTWENKLKDTRFVDYSSYRYIDAENDNEAAILWCNHISFEVPENLKDMFELTQSIQYKFRKFYELWEVFKPRTLARQVLESQAKKENNS